MIDLERVAWRLIYHVNRLPPRWRVNMINRTVSTGSDLFCVLWVVARRTSSKYQCSMLKSLIYSLEYFARHDRMVGQTAEAD